MRIIAVGILVIAIIGGGYFLWQRSNLQNRSTVAVASPVADQPSPAVQPSVAAVTPPAAATKKVTSQSIPAIDSSYKFSVEVPSSWEAEAIGSLKSINFYDSAAPGADNLAKSQIFIRQFSASQFLTLSTVDILERTELTLNGRPTVRYRIKKKSGVANFAGQPTWRNEEHVVTDIRLRDSNPSLFYVIAARPDLDRAVYQRFLDSFNLNDQLSLTEPTIGFSQWVSKKPFGLQVSPSNSPISPERFSGWHAGVDAEYPPGDPAETVPVRAVADGQIIFSGTADGYGGVLVIEHVIQGSPRAVLYGHLDPASIAKVGATIKQGEIIGRLGDDKTAATDGERRHLHFAIHRSNKLNLRGYVANQDSLKDWLDPLSLTYRPADSQ